MSPVYSTPLLTKPTKANSAPFCMVLSGHQGNTPPFLFWETGHFWPFLPWFCKDAKRKTTGEGGPSPEKNADRVLLSLENFFPGPSQAPAELSRRAPGSAPGAPAPRDPRPAPAQPAPTPCGRGSNIGCGRGCRWKRWGQSKIQTLMSGAKKKQAVHKTLSQTAFGFKLSREAFATTRFAVAGVWGQK